MSSIFKILATFKAAKALETLKSPGTCRIFLTPTASLSFKEYQSASSTILWMFSSSLFATIIYTQTMASAIKKEP